jgi:hypothetical protein
VCQTVLSLEKEIVEAIKADLTNTALQRFVEEEPDQSSPMNNLTG